MRLTKTGRVLFQCEFVRKTDVAVSGPLDFCAILFYKFTEFGRKRYLLPQDEAVNLRQPRSQNRFGLDFFI